MAKRPTDDLSVTPMPRYAERRGEPELGKIENTLEKVVSAVNRSAKHTEQIPDIQKKVEATRDKVIALDTKMDGMSERVSKVEVKVDEGHVCQIPDTIAALKDNQRESSQKLELDMQKAVKQSGEIRALKKDASEIEADVADIRKAPRRMFYGLLGIVLSLLTGAAGAIWFIAELNKDVEFERTQRTEQFRRIEKQIKGVAKTANSSTVLEEVQRLEKSVKSSDGLEEEYNTLCVDMPRHEKSVFAKVLKRRGRRIPRSCLE